MAGRNPDDFPGRWITVSEAVSWFRVSERTIRRRIATGLLPTKHESGRVLIYLYDTTPDNRQAASEGDKVTGERLTELQAENRRLADLLSQVEGERDYLRQALAAALLKIPQIEAQASQPGASDPESKPGRPWWKFWK